MGLQFRASLLTLLTFQHWQASLPLYFALRLSRELCFGKQSLGLFHCGSYLYEHSFSWVTESFPEFLSYSSLAHLRILPTRVSIFGTGHIYLTLETFRSSSTSPLPYCRSFPYASRLLVSDGGFACHPDISLAPALPAAGQPSLRVIPSHIYGVQESLPVVHRLRLRPRLRSRLTQSGRTFLWKPCSLVRGISPTFRYSHRHSLFHDSTRPSVVLPSMERSPTIP